jgi:hypothetical protein
MIDPNEKLDMKGFCYTSAIEDARIGVIVPDEEIEVKMDRFLLPWCS